MTHAHPAPGWTLIVPVKATARGKSRIEVEPEIRQRLARALAIDTVTAAAGAESVAAVVVVVENEQDGAMFSGLPGVQVQLTAAQSLNDAIVDGLAGVTGPAAVLPGDLPGLRSADLDAALALAVAGWAVDPSPMAVVADRQGIGTTLLVGVDAAVVTPLYGTDSFRKHRAAGALALDVPPDNWIRRDVDTLDDLMDIRVGRTGQLVAELLVPAKFGAGEAC